MSAPTKVMTNKKINVSASTLKLMLTARSPDENQFPENLLLLVVGELNAYEKNYRYCRTYHASCANNRYEVSGQTFVRVETGLETQQEAMLE